MRKIGAPLALVNGKIVKNCIIQVDEMSKKIANIAVEVVDMDSVALLEYFNGLLLPTVTGWQHPMTADKRAALVATMTLENLHAFTTEPLTEGYVGDILILERLDLKNQAFTPRTTIKKA